MTTDASPPVAVAKFGDPRSMLAICAGAPLGPAPTSTTVTNALPFGKEASWGRYIFCCPLMVTIPKAPVPPAAGAVELSPRPVGPESDVFEPLEPKQPA